MNRVFSCATFGCEFSTSCSRIPAAGGRLRFRGVSMGLRHTSTGRDRRIELQKRSSEGRSINRNTAHEATSRRVCQHQRQYKFNKSNQVQNACVQAKRASVQI